LPYLKEKNLTRSSSLLSQKKKLAVMKEKRPDRIRTYLPRGKKGRAKDQADASSPLIRIRNGRPDPREPAQRPILLIKKGRALQHESTEGAPNTSSKREGHKKAVLRGTCRSRKRWPDKKVTRLSPNDFKKREAQFSMKRVHPYFLCQRKGRGNGAKKSVGRSPQMGRKYAQVR